MPIRIAQAEHNLGGQSSAFITIAYGDYLDRAKALFTSIKSLHPESRRIFLALDNVKSAREHLDALAQVVSLSDLGFTAANVFRRRCFYTKVELATSVKAKFLLSVLQESRRVTYFDPDIQVFRELTLSQELLSKDILLTPHLIHPIPKDGLSLNLRDVQDNGIFNLGFISVTSGAARALNWWDSMLEFDGDFRQGTSFTDQKVAEQLVSLCEVGVVRDETWNVAYWNIHEREITEAKKLTFFHFSGFSPDTPEILTRHYSQDGRHRRIQPVWLAGILRDYASFCTQSRPKVPATRDAAPTFFDEFPTVRELIRQSHLDKSGYRVPPSSKKQLANWLLETGTGIAGSPLVPPLIMAFYLSREDLRHAFPGAAIGQPSDSSELIGWILKDASARKFCASVLQKFDYKLSRIPASASVYPAFHGSRQDATEFGINHISYIGEEVGLADASRYLADLISKASIPQEVIGLPNLIEAEGSLSYKPQGNGRTLRYSHTILGVNADQVHRLWELTNMFSTVGKRIGYWWWEVDHIDEVHLKAARKFNEIWVGSTFVQKIFKDSIPQPVRLVRLPLGVDLRRAMKEKQPKEGKGPVTFFHNSSLVSDPKRKNPLGAALAYMEAFSPEDGALLKLHLTGATTTSWTTDALKEVLSATAHRSDISISTLRMPTRELHNALAEADCYVSLHRSEGLGMNLRDAIALGTPTIATNYGGNLDFMKADTSFLVDFTFEDVGESPYYPSLAKWAEPDLSEAIRFMRTVANDRTGVREMANGARSYLTAIHDPALLVEDFMRTFFEEGEPEDITKAR